MSNFLEIPTKIALPLPTFSQHLLDYISTHFHDTHPESFRKDVETLAMMRRDWIESKTECHPEFVRAHIKYYAQLVFLSTKFPSDINVPFTYHLPFPPTFSLSPDVPISLNSLSFEKACVLYNIAALWGSMAGQERRAEAESIKRALGYLTAAAGILEHLMAVVLPVLRSELSSPHAAGYDITASFLGTIKEFVLAEAQECYWQQAVLQGTYKNGLIGKLSMKVSEYYKAALNSMNGTDYPSSSYFPSIWIAHITMKSLHFEAAAQYRLSQEDLEKSRYGEEIARLKIAEGLCKKGIDAVRKGVADSVVADLKQLQAAINSSLERAVRDNDLVYVQPIPPANQLSQTHGVSMVRLVTPKEVKEPIAWLMSDGGGALFSGLVPYGVHLALSIYDDRKDTLVRELDRKREELDSLAASTLQSLNLPGSIQALDRPIGLPPSLLKKTEEITSQGGSTRIEHLLGEVQRLAKANVQALNEAMDVLDQEATENEMLFERQPALKGQREESHVANQPLVQMAGQYEATIKQAGESDALVRKKWSEWRDMISILSGGEEDINDYVPSSTVSSTADLPPSVRPLRASLELLDDHIAHRARILSEARGIAAADDIRAQVVLEATKLAHGGTGDVKTEWFEDIFDKGLEKYDIVKKGMNEEANKQDELLDQIRAQNEAFISERKSNLTIKERERCLQDMDLAYWKWREIIDNAEEGIKFYNSLADMLIQFKDTCRQFLNSRRIDIGQITHQLQGVSVSDQIPQTQSPPTQSQSMFPTRQPETFSNQTPHSGFPSPQTFPSTSNPTIALTQSPQQMQPAPFLAHPSSASWQSADFLPPPPPPPILRSSGIQNQPRTAPPLSSKAESTPRRVTRASAAAAKDDGTERNRFKEATGRRKGGGVV
ncbi:pH-response regulator protein palA/RIM20 [Cryptococcus depauperatus]